MLPARFIFLAAIGSMPAALVAGETIPTFETDIVPIVKARCWACHSGPSPQAGLDLRTRESMLRGGKSGPTIRPGASEHSLLVEKVVSKVMPPGDVKLTEAEIATIRVWIDKGTGAKTAPEVITENDVLPIFQMRCVVCHGKRKKEGGLDLRTQAARLKGGKSGPALVPGKPDESLTIRRIASGEMPPPKVLVEYFVRPPTTPEIETLRKWIAAGAPPAPKETAAQSDSDPMVSDTDRMFWSFQPPRRPPVPAVRRPDLVRTRIDAFLLEKLEAKGLEFSPEAGRLTLLRRAYLDLIGLPPLPAEVGAYLEDERPDAYERLIDRLLDSPHYGERWAKFWLDAAGYSDSEGIIDEDLIRPNVWRYRDYVIRSLNTDKPYDRFLTEQIAGDELVDHQNTKDVTPEFIEKLVATGFLRMAPDGTYSPANGSIAERMNVIADEIEILSSSVLGLTVGCARCHNHKYDPIPQRDYYRLSAILQTAYDPYDWVKPTERRLDIALESERKEVAAFNAPVEAEIKRLETALEAKAKPLRDKVLEDRLAALPEAARADLQKLRETPEEKHNAIQKYLMDKFADILKVTDEDLIKKFPEFKTGWEAARKNIGDLKKKLRPKPEIRALYEMGGEPSHAYLLRRGDAQLIGEPVEPGTPSVLNAGLEPYKAVPPRPDSSGRRLALARWLVQPNHPLTARGMVNRIWVHYFGRGLVATPSNFGRTGSPPSHPELLDWLATEFVRSGWSMKAIHRLIMTSTAYRQSSRVTANLERIDPENILLSRVPPRRMDAEQLHDSILHVTGRLDATQFGPPVPVELDPGGEIVARPSTRSGWRRAIYTLQRRTTPPTLLEVFDLPPMSPNCIQRSYSTVPTQALQMTNSETIRSHARYLAGRLIDEYGSNQEKQIAEVYVRALTRRPTPEEMRRALEDLSVLAREWESHLNQEKSAAPRTSTAQWSALASFCHAMLSSAGFLYID